jgi:hypothetical protein
LKRTASIALAVLCLAWLVPGLIGHVPWKGGDGAHFARTWLMLHGGGWLTPGLPGEALPPLYYWTAAATAWVSAPFLALHDGARLASGVYIAVALVFTARAAHALYGPEHRWPAVLVLIGSVGLLLRGHEMNAFTAQLAGVAMVLDGLARLATAQGAGATLVAGLCVMLLATGLPEPLAIALGLAFLAATGRVPAARTLLAAIGVWLAAAAAWAGFLAASGVPVGAVLQVQRLPGVASLVPGRPLDVLGLLPWYTWPAWPLAGWALYRSRRDWTEPGVLLPLGVLAVLLLLFVAGHGYGEDKLFAILAPFALLAARGLLALKRGAANALLWFSVMLFSFMALVFWVYWSAHDLGWPQRLAQRLVKLRVEDVGRLRVVPLIAGALVTLAWALFLARLPRTPLRPILAWSAGMTFVWALLIALFLDVFDARLGYARVATEIRAAVPAHECVIADRVPAQQRVLIGYHSGRALTPRRDADCRWLLVQVRRREAARPVDARWVRVLDSARPGDREDRFRLYVRK